MNIAIDGRGAFHYRGTGIGTYTWRLIDAFEHGSALNAPKHRLRVFLPGEEYRGITIGDNAPVFPHQGGDLWRDYFLGPALQREKAELYHVPQNGIGLPKEKQCLETVTIHDMIPYVFPETVGKGYLKEFLGEMPSIIQRSDGIITVSECSKNDILRLFDYPEDRIAVIAEAAEPIYRPIPKEKAKAFLGERYGIFGDYLIYVGGYGIRKNVKALLVALSLLKKENDINVKLVLPGKRHRDFDQLEQLAEALGIADRVVFPGFVPVEELPYFYGGAQLMVYPSLYEGFGLPPLEAMAMGIPVLAARSSSLGEVLGDAAVYFNPLDSCELASYLYALLNCDGKRRIMGEQGLARSKEYSWQKTAQETVDFWEHIKSLGPK
ncbi:MAG: glycosyltransferase family 1 protein [Bacillota bacterium]|nr:glycosyltransferase family 1 protein [Bacillota bacterium]